MAAETSIKVHDTMLFTVVSPVMGQTNYIGLVSADARELADQIPTLSRKGEDEELTHGPNRNSVSEANQVS